MNKEEFINELSKIGIILSNDSLIKLDKYYDLLIDWNKKINLTSIIDKKEVYLKHYYDSLALIKAYDLTKEVSICDIGTGAGFPGLVLKICFPNLNVTLVDSLEKRVKFLNEVISKLNLTKINVYHDRAELFCQKNREKFDLVTSRAVAKLNILTELCIPLVKVNGYFISLKANLTDEIENAQNSLIKLNSELEEIISFNLPVENSVRNLVKIIKIKETSLKYPRNFDKIKKNPL